MPPAAIFLSTAKEIWKRTPPKTNGFWISLSSNCNCGAKRFRKELPPRLSPLPLPRSTRWCAQIAPAVFKLASLPLPRATLMVPCAIIVPASAHHRIPAHFRLSLRRGRRPRRPASFFFHAYGGDISRSGATSFCPRRQKDAKTPPKTHGLWNSFRPLAITAQKGPTTNRLYFYPRCRSHAPRGGAMFSQYKKSAAQRAAPTLAAGGGKCAI